MSTVTTDPIDQHRKNIQRMKEEKLFKPKEVFFGKKDSLYDAKITLKVMPEGEKLYCLAIDGFPIRFPREIIDSLDILLLLLTTTSFIISADERNEYSVKRIIK